MYTALEIDNKMIGLADGTGAVFDLLSLLGKTLLRTTGRFKCLLAMYGLFGKPTRTSFCELVACAFKMRLCLIRVLPSIGESLVRGPLFGGQEGTDGLAEFVLDMEQVRRMMDSQGMLHIS